MFVVDIMNLKTEIKKSRPSCLNLGSKTAFNLCSYSKISFQLEISIPCEVDKSFVGLVG